LPAENTRYYSIMMMRHSYLPVTPAVWSWL